MTLPASGTIALSQVRTEMQASGAISMSWVDANTKGGGKNLNSLHGKAWYLNNAGGNCNNGNCNCNCNCGSLQCVQCTLYAINCTNCDARNWLQPNCNCACTYNCGGTANITYNCNCACDCANS